MRNYAVELSGTLVVQVIVGTAEWAVTNLGGEWVDVYGDDHLPGIGWSWSDETGWTPPYVEPVVEEEL